MKKKFSFLFFVFAVVLAATFFLSTIFHFLWIPLPGVKNTVVFYSNQLDSPLRHLVIRSLESAHSTIKLHTYALTDEGVIATLFKKNKEVDLEIITDTKTIPSSYSSLQHLLCWRGVKSSGLMHEKILIVDETTVFLGTANMTYESLSMHDNLILGLYHPPLAKYLTTYTEEIDQKKKNKNVACQKFSLNNQNLELWLLPYKGSAPLDNLKHLIKKASHSLSIAMFTLTHQELIDSVIQAHARGVKVSIFLDATSAKGASSSAAATLVKAGISLHISEGMQLLHHKMMLIDDTCFVLGSANWTKSAFKKNHDFYLVLSPLSSDQAKVMRAVFHKIAKQGKKMCV